MLHGFTEWQVTGAYRLKFACLKPRKEGVRGTIIGITDMTRSKVVLMAAGTALAAAWFSSATTVPSLPTAMPTAAVAAQQAGPIPAQVDLAHEVTRLTARLGHAPRPRVPARNPFAFRPHDPVVAPTGPPTVSMRGSLERRLRELADAPSGHPSVTLAGVGSEPTATGVRYTAVLSVSGRVLLVNVGDDVIGRYQVRAVSNDAVELRDRQGDATVHLTLP